LFAGTCGPDAIKGSKPTDCCNDKISEISEANMALWVNAVGDTFNGFKKYPATPGFPGTGGTYVDATGIERNNLGLSTDGERVVRRAMELGMIVNIDHVSSEARDDIHAISTLEFGGYPLNALHNNPNARLVGSGDETPFPSEYDFSKAEREYVRDTGGIFGVRLAPLDAKEWAASGVSVNCPGTSTETAKILAFLLDQDMKLGYSLDFAGGTEAVFSRTHEGCGTTLGKDWIHTDGVEQARGLAHIGMMKYWHKELEEIGLTSAHLDQLKNDGAEAFLDMWEDSERQSAP
jgi:microsomal dipeptidase-like Zn-dependent dipeptidase